MLSYYARKRLEPKQISVMNLETRFHCLSTVDEFLGYCPLRSPFVQQTQIKGITRPLEVINTK